MEKLASTAFKTLMPKIAVDCGTNWNGSVSRRKMGSVILNPQKSQPTT